MSDTTTDPALNARYVGLLRRLVKQSHAADLEALSEVSAQLGLGVGEVSEDRALMRQITDIERLIPTPDEMKTLQANVAAAEAAVRESMEAGEKASPAEAAKIEEDRRALMKAMNEPYRALAAANTCVLVGREKLRDAQKCHPRLFPPNVVGVPPCL